MQIFSRFHSPFKFPTSTALADRLPLLQIASCEENDFYF